MRIKKTAIEQYALLIKDRLKSIENLEKIMLEENSPELNCQLKMERRSLFKLLTESYYSKRIRVEKRALIKKYIKGYKN